MVFKKEPRQEVRQPTDSELSDKPLLQNLEHLTSENKQLHATAQSVTNILTLDD